MSTGLVLLELDSESSTRIIRFMVEEAVEMTPAGRYLCVTFPLPSSWTASTPFDAIVTTAVLGRPETRIDQADWEFAGNGCMRLCASGEHSRTVDSEIGLLLFRRSGAKPFARKAEVSKDLVDEAILPALHPVFTRDVANNVWHLPVEGYRDKIRNRLQTLFSWPDERMLIISRAGRRWLKWHPMDLDDDLVGVPEKQHYPWADPQFSLLN